MPKKGDNLKEEVASPAPRRSTRISQVAEENSQGVQVAPIGTRRRSSASEAISTPTKIIRAKQLSQSEDVGITGSSTPIVRKTRSGSKSPAMKETIPLRRSTRLGSASSLADEETDVRIGSPIPNSITMRRRMTRSMSREGSPEQEKIEPVKPKKRRNSTTDKTLPIIEETEPPKENGDKLEIIPEVEIEEKQDSQIEVDLPNPELNKEDKTDSLDNKTPVVEKLDEKNQDLNTSDSKRTKLSLKNTELEQTSQTELKLNDSGSSTSSNKENVKCSVVLNKCDDKQKRKSESFCEPMEFEELPSGINLTIIPPNESDEESRKCDSTSSPRRSLRLSNSNSSSPASRSYRSDDVFKSPVKVVNQLKNSGLIDSDSEDDGNAPSRSPVKVTENDEDIIPDSQESAKQVEVEVEPTLPPEEENELDVINKTQTPKEDENLLNQSNNKSQIVSDIQEEQVEEAPSREKTPNKSQTEAINKSELNESQTSRKQTPRSKSSSLSETNEATPRKKSLSTSESEKMNKSLTNELSKSNSGETNEGRTPKKSEQLKDSHSNSLETNENQSEETNSQPRVKSKSISETMESTTSTPKYRIPRVKSKSISETVEQLDTTSPRKTPKRKSKSNEEVNVENESPKKAKTANSTVSGSELLTPSKVKSSLNDIEKKIDDLIQNNSMFDSSGSEESENYLDDQAMEGEEDTPSEDSNELVDKGESIGSTSSQIDTDESYERDSFVEDDEPIELLSGDEFDLSQEKQKKKIYQRVICDDSDSDIPKSTQPATTIEIEEVTSVTFSEESIEPQIEEPPEEEVVETNVEEETIVLETSVHDIKRKQSTSLTLSHNISLEEVEDGEVGNKIGKVLEYYCSTIKESGRESIGSVSLNISLDFVPNEGEKRAVKRKSTESLPDEPEIKKPNESLKNISVSSAGKTPKKKKAAKVEEKEESFDYDFNFGDDSSEDLDESLEQKYKSQKTPKKTSVKYLPEEVLDKVKDFKASPMNESKIVKPSVVGDKENVKISKKKLPPSKAGGTSEWMNEEIDVKMLKPSANNKMSPVPTLRSGKNVQLGVFQMHDKDFKNKMLYSNRVSRMPTEKLLRTNKRY